MNKGTTLAIWVLVLLLASNPFSYADEHYYRLHAGEVKVIDISSVKRVAIGKPNILSYRVLDNGQLILMAQAAGETTVHIWKAGGREEVFWVEIADGNISRRLKMARELAEAINGINIKQVDDKIVFYGNISKEDMGILERISAVVPGSLILAKPRLFEVNPMIRIDVKVIEMTKNDISQLGIRWSSSGTGPIVGIHKAFHTNDRFGLYIEDEQGANEGIVSNIGVTDHSFFGYAGLTTSLSSSIDLLKQSGKAKVIASPKLSARSGELASFLAGGEIPIVTIGAFGGSHVSFREYGIKLDIEPTAIGDEIKTRVLAEVSGIDQTVEVGDVPGLLVRRTDTVVNVKQGETLAISGMVSAEDSSSAEKVPFLGDIPGLGKLFRSEGKRFDSREIVILVTPRLIEPNDKYDGALQNFANPVIDYFKSKESIDSALLE